MLRKAFETGLIEDDIWMEMLKVRNEISHDFSRHHKSTSMGEFWVRMKKPLFRMRRKRECKGISIQRGGVSLTYITW